MWEKIINIEIQDQAWEVNCGLLDAFQNLTFRVSSEEGRYVIYGKPLPGRSEWTKEKHHSVQM